MVILILLFYCVATLSISSMLVIPWAALNIPSSIMVSIPSFRACVSISSGCPAFHYQLFDCPIYGQYFVNADAAAIAVVFPCLRRGCRPDRQTCSFLGR